MAHFLDNMMFNLRKKRQKWLCSSSRPSQLIYTQVCICLNDNKLKNASLKKKK